MPAHQTPPPARKRSVISERALVEPRIEAALERGPCTFDELLAHCSSLLPDKLQNALDELEERGAVRRTDGGYVMALAQRNSWPQLQANWPENLDVAHGALSRIMESIHPPHALDYEWWFSHTSREELAKRMLWDNELPLPKSLAFLGSPIFGAFISRLLPEREVFILDKSATTLEAIDDVVKSPRLHLVHYDAEQPLPEAYLGAAEMAFFDPPWYVDYYDLFFTRCAQLTSGHFATIGAVLFPVLTRPNALAERAEVLATAMRLGLSPTRLLPQVAEYLTPQFEHEALAQRGVIAKNWRKGDLAVFLSAGSEQIDNSAIRVEQHEWKEIVVGRVRVKVRMIPEEQSRYVAPTLRPIQDGHGQLAAIGRYDPIRGEIGLWTSTHLGFGTTGCLALLRVVEGIRDGQSADEIVAAISQDHPVLRLPSSVREDVANVLPVLREALQTL